MMGNNYYLGVSVGIGVCWFLFLLGFLVHVALGESTYFGIIRSMFYLLLMEGMILGALWEKQKEHEE